MDDSQVTYANVRVFGEDQKVIVPISSDKPLIPESVLQKWQKIVNLVAKIMKVPTGLITHLTEEKLEIFIASQTKGNPYARDDNDSLGIGMFCETVAGRNKAMLVQNTDDEEYWRTNPHAGLGMHSYLGVPIVWEDGEIFGTFCMLNDQSNRFTDDFMDLMIQFKEIIETDLQNVLLAKELEDKLSVKDLLIREVHHRTKNHFNLLLSFINIQKKKDNRNFEEILRNIQNRIHAISMVHENLYAREDSGSICLCEYMKKLTSTILDNVPDTVPDVVCNIKELLLSAAVTVPLGLIITELISNSVKYAFSETGKSMVTISVSAKDDKYINIEYKDNGKGYPNDFRPDNPDTLGIMIVRMLCEQLGGKAEFTNNDGAVFRTIIKI